MRMLNDNVLVKELESGSRSDGGIMLPDSAKKKSLSGTIIALGPGPKMENGERYEMDLKVGEVVFYPPRTGDHVTIDGEEYLCIQEKYICGVSIEADDEE